MDDFKIVITNSDGGGVGLMMSKNKKPVDFSFEKLTPEQQEIYTKFVNMVNSLPEQQ